MYQVYYNGVDITGAVTGDLGNWGSQKLVTFTASPGAYLIITGRDFEAGSQESVPPAQLHKVSVSCTAACLTCRVLEQEGNGSADI